MKFNETKITERKVKLQDKGIDSDKQRFLDLSGTKTRYPVRKEVGDGVYPTTTSDL